MADGIIGSVGVAVVPDADNFFRDFIAKTSRQADNAGRELGSKVRRGMEEELARPVNVKVNADTAKARAEIAALARDSSKSMQDTQRQSNLLRDAIIALGPAAIPTGAVLAGAFIAAVPALVAVGLGIKGIEKDMKSGSLAGTRYGQDINKLKGEVGKLQQVSAKGLLSGIDQALQHSGPLFRTLNTDIGGMGYQIGSIVGSAAPALVALLHDINPLLTTFGTELTKGAQYLEHLGTSGSGVEKFVAYVQAELPTVEHTLGQLIVLVGHLTQGFAPLGHVVLTTLGVLASALNAIPVDVLTKLETGAVAAYAAFRTYGLISGIVKTVTGALETQQAKTAAATAANQANLLGLQATEAATAAEFAQGEATKAAAAATAATEIAAALEGTGSILAAQASDAALASIEFAAAMQAEADAAALSSTEIAATAAAAAESVAGSGEAASIGWAGMLGPVGALAVGVGILGATFLSTSDDTLKAKEAQDSYATSVQKSTDALNQANLAATAKNLSDQGALDLLDQLHKGSAAAGIGYGQLAQAVNGSLSSFDALQTKLDAVAQAHSRMERAVGGKGGAAGSITRVYDSTGLAAQDLLGKVRSLRDGLTAQIKTQLALNAAQRASNQLADGGSTAAQRQATALGLTRTAYLDAQTAAQKATESARANTVAMQLESDAAGLLTQAFDKMNGKTLDVSDARIQFASSLAATTKALHKHKDAWTLDTQAGRDNQTNVNASIKSAQTLAEAVSGGTKLTRDGVAAYRESLIVLRQHIQAQGGDESAIKRVNQALHDLGKIPPTKADLNTDPAETKIAQLQDRIASIRQGQVPGIDANSDAAHAKIKTLQAEIDAIKQRRRPIVDAYVDPAMANIRGVQFALDHLHDKTITVTTRTVNQTASTRSSQVPGSAAGTRATFGTPYVPPNTVSTVGEAGYEGLITDSKGRASILSNTQAKAAGIRPGGPLPGFAKGTASLLGLIRHAGFSGHAADIMYGIVEAESGGRPRAHNFNLSTGDDSYGLAQINMLGSLGPARRAQYHLASNAALYNPATNLRVAYAMSSHGRDFSPWSTYNSGAYLSFMGGDHGATVHGAAGGGGGGSGAGLGLGPITVTKSGGKSVFHYGGQTYSAMKDARAARASDAQRLHSAASSRASGILGAIGQRPSPQLSVAGTGIQFIDRQILAAQRKLADIANLSPKDRAKYQHDLAKLVHEAQRQFERIKLHIRTRDIKGIRDALSKTAADARAAFAPLFADLKDVGASGHELTQLHRQERALLADIRARNVEAAKLDRITNRMKDLRTGVRAGVVGSFDITSAGVNPVSGNVTGGSLLAQQTQALNRVKKFVHLAHILEHRHLVRPYLNSLLMQGPSALPQLEALAAMGDKQFSTFNAQERDIFDLGNKAGRGLAQHNLGGQRADVLKALKDDRTAVHDDMVTLATSIHDDLHNAVFQLKVGNGGLIQLIRKEERKHDRRHGVPGGKK